MAHLGVPMVVKNHMLVVRDEDYHFAIQNSWIPDLNAHLQTVVLHPKFWPDLPDPEGALQAINDNFKHLGASTTTFNYPAGCLERDEHVILLPNSFAHLKLQPDTAGPFADAAHYDLFGNIWYPHEGILVESLVKAAVDEESFWGSMLWHSSLEAWVLMMVGYLDIQNDIIDDSDDGRAVAWYSERFGRMHEEKYGVMDCRVMKRLRPGKERLHDMAGSPIQ